MLILLFSTPVYATDSNEYTLVDLGMKISLPSEFIVFTRDIDANNPNLSVLGFTKEELTSLMCEQNEYLYGFDENENNDIDITVRMVDSPFVDFNLFSDTTLSIMATSLETEYRNAGMTVIRHEIYDHS